MRKIVALTLAVALLTVLPGVAMATQVHSVDETPRSVLCDVVDPQGAPATKFVDAFDDPQTVTKYLPITLSVQAVISIDTFDKVTTDQKDELDLGPGDPKFSSVVGDGIDWIIKSNKPFTKSVKWSDLVGCPGTEAGDEGDLIPAALLKVTVDDGTGPVIIENGWISPQIGDATTHQHAENLWVEYDIQWCDTAGIYCGTLELVASQV